MNGREPYARPCKELSDTMREYVDGDIERCLNQRLFGHEPYAHVGDKVWCVFNDTPEGKCEPGMVTEVRTNGNGSSYEVLHEESGEYERFLDEDWEHGCIWKKGEY